MAEFPRELDLVYRVLDDQLVDVDGRRCGRVDDMEFEGDIGAGPPTIAFVLSGSGSWHRRLPRPLRALGAKVFGSGVLGRDVIRVPWDQVDEISSVIKLKAKARDLGLAQGDDREGRRVAHLPSS